MYLRKYTPADASVWDDFVQSSRNATFILQRRFMDYHSTRFNDLSVMIYDDHNKLVALFPATYDGKCVSSHAGLTYGGLLLGPSKPTAIQVVEIFALLRDHYKAQGYDTLLYRAIPHIYHKYPAEEDLYALFLNNASVESVLVSSVIDMSASLPFNTSARRHVKRAEAVGLLVERSTDYAAFWKILEERLASRYSAHPVHSLSEIELLRGRFPNEIQLWTVVNQSGEVIAGTVLFVSGAVVKAQYIASTCSGREINAVDYLFSRLIEIFRQQGCRYLDLGTSCENGGREFNAGLLSQKCGYGGRAVVCSTYRVTL